MLIIILTAVLPLFAAKGNQLTMSGSTTVLPIAQAGAEAFMTRFPDVNISVRGGGSGVGIAALMNKTVDIANSSRRMKAKELTQAKSNGVNPIAYEVANDGITIVVNKNNPLKNITIKQLKDIYSGKLNNWNQLGGANIPIVVISRDVSSGTYEVFSEKVMTGSKIVDSAQMLASNNAIANTIASTPGAISYIGLGYVTPDTKVLSVENVIPSEQTIKSMTYKLSRKLYMYTNGAAKGNAARFISWLQSTEGQKIVEEHGFISLK